MQQGKTKSKQHFDKTAKPLSQLEKGNSVYIQKGKVWEPGEIISNHNNSSYQVQTPDGAIYRRNRKFINKSHQLQTESSYQNNDQFQTNYDQNSNSCEPNLETTSKVNAGQYYRTRSGREVKPPSRYTE